MTTKYFNPITISGYSVWQIEEQFVALPGNKYLYFKSKIGANEREDRITFQIRHELTDEIVGHADATLVDEKTTIIEFTIYGKEYDTRRT